jgi:hypothetical protein
MSITRRWFLRAGSLVALSAAIPLKSAFGQELRKKQTDRAQEATRDQLANYHKAAFESYLNSIFRLYTGSSVVEVALIEVKDIGAATATARPQPGAESFKLVFKGGTKELDQGTYQLEHPALGLFRLFLVSGTPDDNGAMSYVAIINRVPYDPTAIPSGTTRPVKPAKPETTAPAKPVAPVKTGPSQTETPSQAKPEPAPTRRTKPPTPSELE